MLASQLFRACVPSDEIRVTLSIKTFARGTSSPPPRPLIRPLSHRLPRPQLQKTWREKIRLQRNNELHEEGTQPGGRKLQFSEHPVPSDAPPPPHARFAYATNIPSVHTLYDFTILSYRDSTNVVFAQHSYTRRHGTYDSQQGK